MENAGLKILVHSLVFHENGVKFGNYAAMGVLQNAIVYDSHCGKCIVLALRGIDQTRKGKHLLIPPHHYILPI